MLIEAFQRFLDPQQIGFCQQAQFDLMDQPPAQQRQGQRQQHGAKQMQVGVGAPVG